MEPDYASRYQQYYEQHWWWRAREHLVIDAVRRFRPEGGYGAILDVGCGDGWLFPKLSEFGQPEGVEADASLVSSANHPCGKIHIQPFDRSFDPDTTYGLVLMLDVLEHLDAPLSALRHALALLGPGGRLIITVPAFSMLWTGHDDLNLHQTRYTKRSFRQLADRAGLSVDRCFYFYHWLFPAKLAVRVKEWLVPAPNLPPEIPPRAVNQLLYHLSRLEQLTLGKVPLLPLPGSSLLACGHRA